MCYERGSDSVANSWGRWVNFQCKLTIESLRFELAVAPAVFGQPIGTLAMNETSHQYVIELIKEGANPERADRSLKTFALRARYEIAKDEAFRLRRQLRTLFSRQSMVAEVMPELRVEIADTVGFDLSASNYKNALLGKMKSDILHSLREEFPPQFFESLVHD